MKKCYIAGKIGDLPQAEYEDNFYNAKIKVLSLGFAPVSPVDLPHNHGKTWNEYMKEDLIAMLQCDCVYAMHNWRLSEGATIEVNLATAVGIDVIHQKK